MGSNPTLSAIYIYMYMILKPFVVKGFFITSLVTYIKKCTLCLSFPVLGKLPGRVSSLLGLNSFVCRQSPLYPVRKDFIYWDGGTGGYAGFFECEYCYKPPLAILNCCSTNQWLQTGCNRPLAKLSGLSLLSTRSRHRSIRSMPKSGLSISNT